MKCLKCGKPLNSTLCECGYNHLSEEAVLLYSLSEMERKEIAESIGKTKIPPFCASRNGSSDNNEGFPVRPNSNNWPNDTTMSSHPSRFSRLFIVPKAVLSHQTQNEKVESSDEVPDGKSKSRKQRKAIILIALFMIALMLPAALKLWSSSKAASETSKTDSSGKSIVTEIKSNGETNNPKESEEPDKINEFSNIALSHTSADIVEGDSLQLTASVFPENTHNSEITWNSSDLNVAIVDNNGLVSAKHEGSATITATSGEITATCKITVTAAVIEIEAIQLNTTSMSLKKGAVSSLTVSFQPENATNTDVKWSSSNPSVAIFENGAVSAKGKGKATITAVCGNATAECVVTVTVPVSFVSISAGQASVNNGGTTTLSASVSPSDASDQTITWSSSDPAVATVEDGVVSAVGDGETTIVASAGGKSAQCVVTVATVWSEWKDTPPQNDVMNLQTRTVYRYRNNAKDTIKTTSSTREGWTQYEKGNEYGDWSDWTDAKISSSSNLEVDTRQVVDVEGHTEYRYGRWRHADGSKWYCYEYCIQQLGGSAELEYTEWGTKQKEIVSRNWQCGGTTAAHPRHINPAYEKPGSTAGWHEYEGTWYWEESRWVDTTYKTQYRSRTVTTWYYYYIWLKGNWSDWSETPYYSDGEKRDAESKTQYRYMITQ